MSMVRLGLDMGILQEIDKKVMNELFIMIQPAHLQKIDGRKLNSAERDIRRAQLIREKIRKPV
jgi:protein arginine kinase